MFFKKKDDSGKNRRRHERVASRNLVRVLREDGSELERLTNIFDLSEGGVRLVCHEALPGQTPLQIILNVPEENVSLEIRARVTWICPMKGQKGAFFAGIQFTDIKENDREILRRIIARKFPGDEV